MRRNLLLVDHVRAADLPTDPPMTVLPWNKCGVAYNFVTVSCRPTDQPANDRCCRPTMRRDLPLRGRV